MNHSTQSEQGHKLLKYGILLFLLGLLTGFVIPAMQNPRMGLSSHLEAVMNGMFLVLLGIIWPKLRLSDRLLKWSFFLALFGTYTNWITTLLAGIWGAGADMMPIAAGGFYGVAWQEALIKFGLISLSLAMVIVSGMSFWGLRSGASNS
ncbi:MAG: hydrogenase [Calditrichaceae bacterium]